jgi:hypothetical protein
MVQLKKVALAAALAVAAAAASATPVTIQNPYVLAGVSDYGTLGSNGGTPPGILFDPTGTSNYGNNDFLTPGDPFEGFYLKSSAGSVGSNNDGGTSFATGSPTSLSATSASWTGTAGGYTVTNLYTLTTASGRSEIAIHTTITNVSGSDITGLEFLRTLDPDPDVNNFGSYFTTNTVVDANTACGTGVSSGQTICINSTDSDFTHLAGVASSWSTNPDTYLAGVNDGDGDYAIGLAFNIGNLASGASVSLDYNYAAGATISVVTGVPEPTNIALMLAGLGLVGVAARRRRA